MKKRIAALCAALLLVLAAASAAADYQLMYGEELEPISARLNQKMALRTGPGTKYTELGTYPKSTPIVVYEQEMGGSVSWVMLEFRVDGGLMRAYTGMKRIDSSESIPWANTETYAAKLNRSVKPLRGPGGQYAVMKSEVSAGKKLTVYNVENGYVMADFQYSGDDSWVRAWFPQDAVTFQ